MRRAIASRSPGVVPLSLALGAAASLLLGVGLARAVPEPSDTMPLSSIKPGMKGYGLTVMSGTKPEKFDVEVIATLHNFRPNQDLVLIKTPHPRLNVAHTVAGMSGSPIYLEGKMIGAYAYGWPFGSEAIAGVTPIKSMLEELQRPIPRALLPKSGPPLSNAREAQPARAKHAFSGAPEQYDLRSHAKEVAALASKANAPPESTQLVAASTPIMLGGVSDVGMKLAKELFAGSGLEPLQVGGGTNENDPSAPTKYEDGGAIGVELVKGDVSAMGLGTVTRVSGDKLVAFGHPMLGGGVESLPTAIGRVHWILASEQRSFKIGEAVRSLGALVNDRPTAIVVDTKEKAPQFPVKMTIDGVEGVKKVWNMEVAGDQFMAPSFVSMALGSAAETVASERRDLTWRASHVLKIKGHGSIKLVDYGSGNGSPLSSDDFARGRLVKAVGAVLNNPWEDATIEGVETEMKVEYAREVYALRSAKILEPVLEPGESARIRVELQPYQGAIEVKTIEVPIPKEMVGHELDIDLSAGYEVERPFATPDSLSELLAMLPNQYYDAESIVATFRSRETGAAFKGKVDEHLPAGALELLRPTSDSDQPEAFASQIHVVLPLHHFIYGHDSVHVEVRQSLR